VELIPFISVEVRVLLQRYLEIFVVRL